MQILTYKLIHGFGLTRVLLGAWDAIPQQSQFGAIPPSLIRHSRRINVFAIASGAVSFQFNFLRELRSVKSLGNIEKLAVRHKHSNYVFSLVVVIGTVTDPWRRRLACKGWELREHRLEAYATFELVRNDYWMCRGEWKSPPRTIACWRNPPSRWRSGIATISCGINDYPCREFRIALLENATFRWSPGFSRTLSHGDEKAPRDGTPASLRANLKSEVMLSSQVKKGCANNGSIAFDTWGQ